MFIISISLNILLVLGADDHNDEHWFLQNDLIVSCCRRPRLQVKSYSAQTQSSLTSLRYLSIHLVMPILRSGLSNMSICKEKDRVKVAVWRVTQKQRWWRHERTHCWFKSLISQKFGKRKHFSSYVHRICDENIACQQKVSITTLTKPIPFCKNMKRSLCTHFHEGPHKTYDTHRVDWQSSGSPLSLVLDQPGRSVAHWPHV